MMFRDFSFKRTGEFPVVTTPFLGAGGVAIPFTLESYDASIAGSWTANEAQRLVESVITADASSPQSTSALVDRLGLQGEVGRLQELVDREFPGVGRLELSCASRSGVILDAIEVLIQYPASMEAQAPEQVFARYDRLAAAVALLLTPSLRSRLDVTILPI
jgi:hypothetical protein